MRNIKEKDYKNILKMIEIYHEEVITIKTPCLLCEHWGFLSCKFHSYGATLCPKIETGMRIIFEDN